MTLVQINGSTQIKLNSVSDDRLIDRYIKANGSRTFTAHQSMNGFRLTDLADPVTATDAATRQYVHSALFQTFGTATPVGKSLLSAGTVAAARQAIQAEDATRRGQPGGYPSLDETGKIPASQLPSPDSFQITKADIGLSDVDNTSDATKWAAPATLTNKTIDATNTVTVKASQFTLVDSFNPAKKAQFDLSSVPAVGPVSFVLPNGSTTLVGTNSAQTLTGKTISGSQNTITDLPQSSVVSLPTALAARELIVNRGQANGYVPLNASGKIDPAYLPSYVDEIIEVPTQNDLPEVGSPAKIYVTTDTQALYRWTGSAYVMIGGDPNAQPGNYAATIGNGTDTTFVVTHDLNTTDVLVSVWDVATGTDVDCIKARSTQNSITVTFSEAPASNSRRVVVLNGGVVADQTTVDVPSWSTSTLSAAGTLAAVTAQTYIVFLAAGAAPVLPNAAGNTSRYILKNISNASCVIATTAPGIISDFGATLSLPSGSSIEVVSDGTNWRII